MKRCNGCGEVKPLDEYHRKTRSKDGRQGRCKECNYRAKPGNRGQVKTARALKTQGLKRCPGCGVIRVLNTEFYPGKESRCRDCRHPEWRARLARRIEARILSHDNLRRCGRCHTIKHLDEFNLDASRSGGVHPYCRDCATGLHRSWYRESGGLEWHRQWLQENQDKQREYERRAYQRKKEIG